MGRHLRSGLLALAVLIAGWSLGADGQERTVPRSGGILKVALNAEPPSLDLQWSTALATQQIGWHLYETLYTLDRDYNPIPLLAEGHTVSDGGRRYTITLRRGVRFHDGREMTSADVVASLQRWGRGRPSASCSGPPSSRWTRPARMPSR